MTETLPTFEDLMPLLPGIGAGLFIISLACLLVRFSRKSRGAFLAGFAVPVAVTVTYGLLDDWQIPWPPWDGHLGIPWPPTTGKERALTLCFVGAFISLAPRCLTRRPTFLGPFYFLSAAGALLYLLHPFIDSGSGNEVSTRTTLFLVLMIGVALSLGREVNRWQSSRLLIFALGVQFVTAAQTYFYFGVTSVSQLLATAGMVALVWGVFLLFKKNTRLIEKVIPSAFFVFFILTSNAHFFGDDVPPLQLVGALVALPWVVIFEPVLIKLAPKQWIARGILVAALIGCSIWVVCQAYENRPQLTDYMGYELEEGK